MANTYNPFRYRGYYYDVETELYYLQSRYYNPAWGRFINADGYVNANGDILGYNMYAYCGNNPVMYVDPEGESVIGIVTAVVVGVSLLFGLQSDTPVESTPPPTKDENIVDKIHLYVKGRGNEIYGKINVVFSPTGRNPSFQIRNSCEIRKKEDQRAILEYIIASDFYSQEIYGRTVDSMLVEWYAHNVAFFFLRTEQFQHTDFDKNSEGKTFFDFVWEKVRGDNYYAN